MIDSQGRVFGMINLIDLAIALSIIFVIALGVQGYRVFRIPTPIIERVEPSAVVSASGQTVRIVGRNFRQYLHVFAPRSGQPFAVTPLAPEGPEVPIEAVTDRSLDLGVQNLAPGSSDIYVFDNARELAHLPAALTITPAEVPRATIRLLVRLLLSKETAGQLHLGDRDSAPAATSGAAEIETLDVRPDLVDVMDLRIARQQLPGDHYLWMGAHTSQVIADAVLRVPVVASKPGRWEYKGRTVRAGEEFAFETASTNVRGTIVRRDDPEVASR